MAQLHVPRFWHSPEQEPVLDDDGLLLDPVTHRTWATSAQTVDPAVIPACLVVLGEPGVGKTVVLNACRDVANAAGRVVLEVDLRSIDSSDSFRDAVFRDPAFQTWLHGNTTLELFLDSLDECLTESRKIAAVLVERLPKLPADRLNLRIGCRSADWPQLLENQMKELWRDGLGVKRLAPLRAEDVSAIAADEGVDGESFLAEVRQRGVGALAARPITLKLLLATFRQHFALPGRRADLYRDALVLLCQEQNPSRLASRQVSRYAAAQLLACASRIAAALVLCNRYGIADAPQVDRPGPPIITIDDVAGGVETANGEEFIIDREVVRDTLATGLFEPAGGGVHTFAHRTFAEYLAACYLARPDFTVKQILDLVTTSADDRVVPQMRNVAAWVAELRADFRQELIRRDPLTVLRMEAGASSDRDREQVVASLLQWERRGSLPRFELRRDFVKLTHPGLAQQLLEQVESHGMSDVVIDIVTSASVREVAGHLVDTVADASLSSDVRAQAAHALLRLKDPSTFPRLAALFPTGLGDDPYDEIRGSLLLLLWPGNLDAETLFDSLVRPNDHSFVGRYTEFLTRHALRGMTAQSLPAALRWVAKQSDDWPDRFHALIASILALGAALWILGGDDDNLFPHALLAQLRGHSEVLDDVPLGQLAELVDDVEARHRLVEILVPHLGERDGYLLIPNARLQFVREDDMQWLIMKSRSAATDAERRLWAELMNRVLREGSAKTYDLILTEAQTNPIVAEEFRWAIQPVELDSAEASRDRKTFRILARSQEPPPEEQEEEVPKLQQLIGQLENADEKWWPQAMTLTFNRREWELQAALNAIVQLTPAVQHPSLLAAAERFLTASNAPADDEIQPRTIHYWSVYGVGAMILLAKLDKTRFAGLEAAVTRKWLPSIVAEAAYDSQFTGPSLDLVRGNLPPDDVARLIDRLITIENESDPDGLHNSLRAAESLPSPAVTKVLVEHLDDPALRPSAFKSLLDALLKQGNADVRDRCEELVRTATASGEADPRAVAAASSLIAYSPDASWSLIWPFVQAVGAPGQKLVESQLPLHRINEFIPKLKDSEIADMVLWLFERHADDELGLESPIGIAINDVLNVLLKRGRVEDLRRIQTAFPNRIREQFILMAQEERQRGAWDPPTPDQLFALATDRRRRIVHDGERLVEVVIESLQRLQAQLHSEDPTAKYLWDGDKPKDEGGIRDWIRKFLNDDDGLPRLITNKEVEVFDRYYTDIKIEAVGRALRRNLDSEVGVTAEVKGCWHDELKKAMETQLVDKYLRGSTSPFGIYLVAWFDSERWSDADGRKKQCHCWSRAEMQEYLDRQAQNLTRQGFFIKVFILDCTVPKRATT